MSNKSVKVYLASGWFGPNQLESIETLEEILRDSPYVNPYFPRHDGVKLKPDEMHESALRKRVFDDNVSHIEGADLVVAVLDSRDGSYDTGTLWECGYAISSDIPVLVYDPGKTVAEDLKSIYGGFYDVCTSEEDLIYQLTSYAVATKFKDIPEKVLFIGPDITEEQKENNTDIISSVIVECHGSNFRWLDDLSSADIYSNIDSLFEGIDYMVAVIDDRHPVVSWMLGQAYKRNIPIITYTNYDYGVNIMLLVSLLYHCKGKEELKETIQNMKRNGIHSLPKFDDSKMRAQ